MSFTKFDSVEALQEAAMAEIGKHIVACVNDESKFTLKDTPNVITFGRGKSNAHYQINVPALNRYKKVQGKPADVAKEYAAKFESCELVPRVTVSGIALEYYLNEQIVMQTVVGDIVAKDSAFGKSSMGANKTVLVEFSSPNIAKPFHAGHLRSTILGNFLQNVHRALGYDVLSYNYLGDWGKQYGLLAVGYQRFGDDEKLKQNPIHHLYDVYVAINQANKAELEAHKADPSAPTTVDDEARAFFARMEAGDAKALERWEEFRNMSIDDYKRVYERLGVHFDVFSGESQVGSGMDAAFELMREKKLISLADDGAQLLDFKALGFKKLGATVIKKKDGTTLYLTRDVAAAKARWDKHQFDKSIYVVGDAQQLHFKQLFKTLELMGYDWAERCQHVGFGLVNGMSSRAGTAVFLDTILDEAQQVMLETMKANEQKFAEIEDPDTVSNVVGMSAVIIQDLGAKRGKNYDFSWERMTRKEGETGPYLQYAHARLASIARKAGVALDLNADLSLLVEPEAHALVWKLSSFQKAMIRAMQSSEPITLVSYLFEVSSVSNKAFLVLKVKGSEIKLAQARLLLFTAARIVMANGMKLLGLKPLERM